jgi:hypothetical protein
MMMMMMMTMTMMMIDDDDDDDDDDCLLRSTCNLPHRSTRNLPQCHAGATQRSYLLPY